jgi:DNA-binding FrmR family transcriptional regulator
MDIVTQSLAIQKSLSSLSKLTAQHHIETHITDMMTSGDQSNQQKARDELAMLFELTNVRSK